MSLKGSILDGIGKGFEAQVTDRNALKVVLDTQIIQPEGTTNTKRFFKNTLENTHVDGSITPVMFTLNSSLTHDIYVTRIVWVLSDGSNNLSKYGAIPSLTNGTDLYIEESGDTTFLVEKAQTGGQVAVEMGMFSPFGSAANVNTVTGWEGNNDALICSLDIQTIMGEGLRLGRGSLDQIVLQVNDDLTLLADQFVTFFGYELHE